jgi:ferredoxin-nitrite reductase
MSDKSFTEEQKQYLSGFAFGTDVARAVSNLPIISGSGGRSRNAAAIQIGGGPTTIDGTAFPTRPENIALQAQADTEAAGGKLCNEEKAKREKNPLDMWDEIVAKSDAGEFPKGTDVFLTKFQGLFHVAPAQNSFMCRMRIPGGLLYGWQFRGLADLSDVSAGGYIDITTRANLQFREIPADQAANILYGIRELDVVSLGSGGDNIRNCTASALSGIDTTELVETIPMAKRMHHYILNHREMYGLPRKFNIAFDGGGSIASLDDTNDIGFRAVNVPPEHASEDLPQGVYFQLTLGGITGHKDFARPTGVLLDGKDCYEVAGGIVRVFVKSGDRTDRKKARLKYVLDDWGFDKFIAAVEEEIGKPLRRVSEDRIVTVDNEDRLVHVGFHRQAQTGKQYCGVVLPVGRITSDQARQLSDIADELGNGEIRFTVWQNLIIPNIRDEDVEQVRSRIEAMGLGCDASSFRAGLVACTGSAGCKFAASDTKADAMRIAKHLESQFTLDSPINIHVTGCHHSCAQHYIGDIGLIGCKVEQGDDMLDGYHIHLGGGWGGNQGIGRLACEYVTAEDAPETVAALVGGYLERRNDSETFIEFTQRCSDQELKMLAAMTVS